MPTEREEEAFVEQVLDEDLEEYKRLLPEREYRVMRNCLRDEMLFDPAGRARLRAAMAASAATQAGSHVQAKSPEAAEKKEIQKQRKGS